MTVINNLISFCTWRRTVFQALNGNSKNFLATEFFSTKNPQKKRRVIEPKLHAYVVQKADTTEILKNAEKLKEILKKKGRLSAVDMDLCARINTSTMNEILLHLHSFILLDSTYCLDSLFYKVFIEYLRKGSLEQLKWDQLIQIIYYVAYMQDEETKELTIKCLNHIQRRPEMLTADYRDLCVVLQSAFRESTRFSCHENLIKRVKQILGNEFFNLVDNTVWLSMICKGLRITNFNDKQTLTELAENLKKSPLVDRFSIMSASIVIELYSGALLKDELLLNTLVKASAKDVRNYLDKCNIKNRRSLRPPRLKDLGRVMYGLMKLNHPIEKSLLDTVFVPYFITVDREKMRRNFENTNYFEIVCLIGFWFLGYDLSLIGNTCQEVAEAIPESYFRYADNLQCHQFLEILELVYPKLLTPDLHKVKNTVSIKCSLITGLPKRGNLIYLEKTLNKLKMDLNISKCYIENIVPSLCIEGVSVKIGSKKIHIDVLELQYCLLDTEEPNGMMVTKMRLMKYIPGVTQHIVLPNSEIVKLSKLEDEDVISHLKKYFKGSKKVENMYYWQI